MKITTRVFGEIDINDDKIIRFPAGIIGFPDMTEFALIHDEEKGVGSAIQWLQSLQEPNFAMPVMDPLVVAPAYNPQVDDELLKPLGEFEPETVLVMVTLTVPSDIKKMTVNLQAPIIVNSDKCTGVQIIVDSDKFPVRFPIYEILDKMKNQGE